jgi:hypothetical protein
MDGSDPVRHELDRHFKIEEAIRTDNHAVFFRERKWQPGQPN